MRALTYHGARDVRVESVPAPTLLQDDDLHSMQRRAGRQPCDLRCGARRRVVPFNPQRRAP
ncbi:hypothetical protein P5Y53_14370 [Dyella jiangningensis]|nr:hypothetical protein [Dyella jiangningensis]MDG2538857.1 hypothetical protein [Dyella jiangningensis]